MDNLLASIIALIALILFIFFQETRIEQAQFLMCMAIYLRLLGDKT